MRILYVDVDSLRSDHLGCYGYPRATTPTIDRLAAEGTRFERVYASDTPCLPSRTAMFGGRHGVHTGVVDHLGSAADPFPEGAPRRWHSAQADSAWMTQLRRLGYRTATVSPFAERHSAWHWLAGFQEVYDTGRGGHETAADVMPVALDWIERNGAADAWFLHVNLWDVHWPYRFPPEAAGAFAADQLPLWLTEEVREAHWNGYGPKSAQDLGYRVRDHWLEHYPHQPVEIASMNDVRRMFDGYDASVRYVDAQIGRLLEALDRLGVAEETAVVVTSDHGESLGELNMYMSHRVPDEAVAHLPFVIRWPGVTVPGSVDRALHYQFDLAATIVEALGGAAPGGWDARPIGSPALREASSAGAEGRPYLVLGSGAGSLCRSVRWDRFLCLRAYHDGYNGLPEISLFDLLADPHETHDLADERPEVVNEAMRFLDEWYGRMAATATHPVDPLWIALHEGGPQDSRGTLPGYLDRLRRTGRSHWAELLAARHPNEAESGRG